MADTYTLSPDGRIMTFNDGVTTIYTGDVQTYGAYQSQLTTVVLPSSVTTIQAYAFLECAALTTITFNDGVTTIGAYAFKSCLSLTTIVLPDTVTTIGNYAFENCSALFAVLPPFNRLPSQLVTLGTGVFTSTGLLSEPLFPPGITTIPVDTFNLSNITGAVSIPQNGEAITVIQRGAFRGCDAITSLTIGSQITTIGDTTYSNEGAFQNCRGITGTLTIPSSVQLIGNNTFNGNTGITSIVLNNGLTRIGASAFAGCSDIGGIVTIPPTVTAIDGYAFYNCINISEIIYTSSTDVSSTSFLNSTTNITVIPAIEPPTDIQGTPTTISIYLSWTPPTNTGGLPVQSYRITDTNSLVTYTTSDISYNITNLNFNTPYTYTISSYNGVSRSPESNPVTIVTLNKTLVTFNFDPTHLTQTYTGLPAIPVDITTTPVIPAEYILPPLYHKLSYSSTTPPTNAGIYTVDVSLNNTNPYYYGSGSTTLTINRAPAIITITGLVQPFTNSPIFVNINTNPFGLSTVSTYTPIFPTTDISHTAVGTYDVSVYITDPNYIGEATDVLSIILTLPTIIFTNTEQSYTGSPLSITATTVPAPYNVDVSYNGLSTPPTLPGTYQVTAYVNDPAWTGQDISGRTLFIIDKQIVTFTFTNLEQAYTGQECIPVGISTTPSSSYIDGPIYFNIYGQRLQNPPAVPGTYTVFAQITDQDPLYKGSGTATLVILPPNLQLNCSPAPELNALSDGGTFASSITAMVQAQALRTAAVHLASQAQAAICVPPGPPISKYAGGLSSGALLERQIQQAQLCNAQQNLAVAKLRMLPLPPFNPALRFAQYQRPIPPAPCPPVISNAGVPVPINGPCTNVIGINTTWPP